MGRGVKSTKLDTKMMLEMATSLGRRQIALIFSRYPV